MTQLNHATEQMSGVSRAYLAHPIVAYNVVSHVDIYRALYLLHCLPSRDLPAADRMLEAAFDFHAVNTPQLSARTIRQGREPPASGVKKGAWRCMIQDGPGNDA